MFFPYGDEELTWLKKRDRAMASAIERIGLIQRPVNTDLFSALVSYIIEQQISIKAAQTVNQRLRTLVGEVSAGKLALLDAEIIQSCGMSMKKALYIKGVAQEIADGKIDLAVLHTLQDAEIIKQLSSLKGVGVWTAEMLLIFSLKRQNILSWGDLAIRRGICRLYNHTSISREQFERYRKRYAPFNSTASLYLWAVAKEVWPVG